MQGLLRTIIRRRAVALLCLLGFVLVAVPVAAQVVGQKVRIEPSFVLNVPAAEARASANALGPIAPIGLEEVVEVPFRPTMDATEYQRLKEEAEQEGLQSPSRVTGPLRAEPSLFPPILAKNFEGLNEAESGFAGFQLIPPDTHGAIGMSQFVEIVNSRLAVFDVVTGNRLMEVPLNTFFGAPPPPPFQRFLFDSRVVYDRDQDRWVITTTSFAVSPVEQPYFIAVSKTGDATGEFFFYRINVTFNAGDLWDFPQLGLDKNAVIFTANIFGPGFKGADMFAVGKDLLYNGLPFTVKVFSKLAGTLTPPIVLDANPTSFLIANAPFTPLVALYALTNSGDPDNITLDVTGVNVGFYTIPRSARQPSFSALDTLDTRFLTASTQIGNSLFNVHTINFNGFPTPRWYEINTSASTLAQSGMFFSTNNSDDFNASTVANDNKDVFVAWNSTSVGTRDTPAFSPQIRVSGRLQSDPSDIASGSVVFESPVDWQGFRWGDYSAITLDPLDSRCAWGVNEKVNTNFIWGSRLFQACFPQ